MNKNKITSKLQTLTGASRAEIVFLLVLISGLILGMALKLIYSTQSGDGGSPAVSRLVYETLDSLAGADSLMFTGSSLDAGPPADTSIPAARHDTRKSSPNRKIDINLATVDDLSLLPGIGKVMAGRIIEYRRTASFAAPTDLMNVRGIGAKKLKKILPYIKTE